MRRNPCLCYGWYNARALRAAEWTPAITRALVEGPLHYRDILATVRSNIKDNGWSRPRMLSCRVWCAESQTPQRPAGPGHGSERGRADRRRGRGPQRSPVPLADGARAAAVSAYLSMWSDFVDRRPVLLETSRPAVFAVGDVRSGSVKRVASAVGEGAMAVRMVHEVFEPSPTGQRR
jgi:hypothetical protein